MHETFATLVSGLHPKFEQLIRMTRAVPARFPRPCRSKAVYLFSEGDTHLYVGRSNKIRGRWGRHCNPGVTHRMAAFAFKLAREMTGKLTASYKDDENSRKNLMLDLAFRAAFDDAKPGTAAAETSRMAAQLHKKSRRPSVRKNAKLAPRR